MTTKRKPPLQQYEVTIAVGGGQTYTIEDERPLRDMVQHLTKVGAIVTNIVLVARKADGDQALLYDTGRRRPIALFRETCGLLAPRESPLPMKE
jgi:hypothetical protein